MRVTEIEKENIKPIDWSKGGQVVVSKKGSHVVTTGEHYMGTFEGFILETGRLGTSWVKTGFRLVGGQLTIENE